MLYIYTCRSLHNRSIDRATGLAWDALVEYGEKVNILPHIVTCLAAPSNKFAVHLYNKLQNDVSLKISAKKVKHFYVVRNQAARIQDAYGTFVERFDRLVDQWKAHQIIVVISPNREDHLNDESYWELVRMGRAAIPLIMGRYAEDRDGLWHMLLNAIVREQSFGDSAAPYCDNTSFEEWKKYYEDGTF